MWTKLFGFLFYLIQRETFEYATVRWLIAPAFCFFFVFFQLLFADVATPLVRRATRQL